HLLREDRDAAAGVRGVRHRGDPLRLQRRRLGRLEDEAQGDRRVQPDRRAAGLLALRVPPREGEALVAAQLGGHDHFQMGKKSVLDVDRFGGAAVVDHPHTTTLSTGGGITTGMSATTASKEGTLIWASSCTRAE